MSRNSSLVYSTLTGRACSQCEKPIAACICKKLNQTKALVSKDGFIRLRRETKGRNGKGVTIIEGLPLDDQALASLAKQLKNKCGCGGTTRAGLIEIQGEQRQLLQTLLEQQGYKVKIAGA
jgi:translation initiation factor 1